MLNLRYPYDLDCYWIGKDIDGHIAVFVTAGIGPIPKVLLSDGAMERIGEQIETLLRPISGVQNIVRQANPDAFQDLAEKGFFVYDWQEIHGGPLDVYQLVSAPTRPITYDDLPKEISTFVNDFTFQNICFESSPTLDIRPYFESIDGKSHPPLIEEKNGI